MKNKVNMTCAHPFDNISCKSYFCLNHKSTIPQALLGYNMEKYGRESLYLNGKYNQNAKIALMLLKH